MNNGTDSDAEVIAYEQSYGGSTNHAPAVSDDGGAGDVNTAFGVTAFPTVVLIGPDNKLIEQDIFPIGSLSVLEGTFPSGFSPAVQSCSFASVENTDKLEELSVYPNPATNVVNINFTSTNTEQIEITIFNVLGEKIETIVTETVVGENNTIIDLNKYANGQYIVNIQNNDNLSTTKFTVAK